MALYIASYDLSPASSSPYVAFIEQAGRFGWATYMPCSDGALRKLPNTTLIGDFDSDAIALDRFNAAILATQSSGYNFFAPKYVIAQYVSSVITSDETISPNR